MGPGVAEQANRPTHRVGDAWAGVVDGIEVVPQPAIRSNATSAHELR